jgi:nicotinamidase-related amidase
MNTALLLIDIQESIRHRSYWKPPELPAFLERSNALLRGAHAAHIPVVRILHSDGPETADNPWSLASGHVRPLDGLAPFEAAAEFLKHRHSALVGTGLPVWLHQQGIQRLIVAGFRTEQCCETTARHASDEGWEIDFVTEATLTFEIPHASGVTISPADIKLRTEAVLQDRFARVCTVEQALESARSMS